jgi:PAS domain S-box-containing protein
MLRIFGSLVAGLARARRAAREAEELRRSRARLQDAIEALPSGFALYDTAGRFVLCNTRYRTMYAESADLMRPGVPFAEIIRRGAERGQYAFGSSSIDDWVRDRLARWSKAEGTFEQQLATGEWIRVMDRRTSDGGMICVREDITELKQREVTFRALFAANPLPMMVHDFRTLRFLEVNDAAVAHYGYDRDRFLAMTLAELRVPDDVQDEAERRLGDERHRKADGSIIAVEITSHQLSFAGCSAGLRVAIDVTEKKRAEAALRASEERLRKSERHLARAQELADIGSFEGDLNTGAIVWSDNLYRLVGVDKETFAVNLRNVLPLVHHEDRGRYVAWRDSLRGGHAVPGVSYRVIRPDGECRHHVADAEPIRDGEGRIVGLFGTVRDVTAATRSEDQRRALEAQLQHSQRLEALGTLAGGVAHDLNNTLVPVVALTKLVMRRLAQESREHANLATVLRAGERARDLVRQILAFARKDMPTRQRVDLAALLRESLRMVRASIPATITLTERIDAVPLLYGDPAQLHQIVINLVVNAVQAIGGAMGTITVSLALDPAAPLPAESEADARPTLRLSIRDTGCGMDEATMRRAFEPFFTTKPVGEGTGLGLSVVHGIVARHGGSMTVASRPGEGTVFDVYLRGLDERDTALEPIATTA